MLVVFLFLKLPFFVQIGALVQQVLIFFLM